MRAPCVLIFIAGAAAEARPAPRYVPPFERNCMRGGTWAEEQKCIETHAKGAVVRALAPDIKLVGSPDAGQYLFLRFGENWRVVYRPGDENYELVQTGEILRGKEQARRIDLSHHVAIGNTGVFQERISLVCGATDGRCDAYVTACTVMTGGRATETFRGELKPTAEGLTLVGDRSYTGQYCSSR